MGVTDRSAEKQVTPPTVNRATGERLATGVLASVPGRGKKRDTGLRRTARLANVVGFTWGL